MTQTNLQMTGTSEHAGFITLVAQDLANKNPGDSFRLFLYPKVALEPLECTLTQTGPKGRTTYTLSQRNLQCAVQIKREPINGYEKVPRPTGIFPQPDTSGPAPKAHKKSSREEGVGPRASLVGKSERPERSAAARHKSHEAAAL